MMCQPKPIRRACWIVSLALLAVLLFAAGRPAHAWYMELTNVKGNITAGTLYWQEINFYSDAGSNMLNDFFLTVDYDQTKVALAGILFDDYDNGDPFFPETVWDGNMLPYINNGDLVYNLMGSETFAYIDQYFPAAGDTRYVRIAWNPLITATDVTVAVWGDAVPSDFTTVDNIHYWMPTDPQNTSDDPVLEVVEDTLGNTILLRPFWLEIDAAGLPWTANIDTTVVLPVVLTPAQNGSLSISASSSLQEVVSDGSIVVCTDEQGTTPLASPFPVSAGSPVTLYLAVRTQDGENARATTQITVDISDNGNTSSASFDLTVDLAEATLDFFGGKTTYRKSSPVTLSGEKARGSQIFLWIGGDDPFEIVSTTVDGDWSYDWNITTDGVYNFSLINRAGTVEETFATGTMVLDTLAPQVPISRRTLTGVSFNSGQPGVHQISMRAEAPSGADSDRFMFCLDGEKNGSPKSYGEVNVITGGAVDGTPHQVAAIPVDAAGNQQAGCNGKPVAWSLSADRTQISNFAVSLVEPAAGPAYVELKWPVDPDSPGSSEVRVWAKSLAGDAYTELPGPPVADAYGNWWIFNDPASPARIRSYLLTDASGTVTLVEFERLDDPRSKSANPMAPILLLLLNDS